MKNQSTGTGKWVVEDFDELNSQSLDKKMKKRKKTVNELPERKTDCISQKEMQPSKKKKRNHKKKVKESHTVENADINKEKCIIYLKKWHEDRLNWKFEKLRQVWLFRNMLDREQVPDSAFQILVNYISGSKGQARQMVVEKTMKVIKAMEMWTELSEQGLEEKDILAKVHEGRISDDVYERAKAILQILEDV